MRQIPLNMTAERWLLSLFSAKAAREGGVIRRNVQDVDRLVGRNAFIRDVNRRGFQLLRNGSQYIVICNAEPLVRVGPQNSSKNFDKTFEKVLAPSSRPL